MRHVFGPCLKDVKPLVRDLLMTIYSDSSFHFLEYDEAKVCAQSVFTRAFNIILNLVTS